MARRVTSCLEQVGGLFGESRPFCPESGTCLLDPLRKIRRVTKIPLSFFLLSLELGSAAAEFSR